MSEAVLVELLVKGGLNVLAAAVLVVVGRFLSGLFTEIKGMFAAYLKAQQETLASIDKRLDADAVERERRHGETKASISDAAKDVRHHVSNALTQQEGRLLRALSDERPSDPGPLTARSAGVRRNRTSKVPPTG